MTIKPTLLLLFSLLTAASASRAQDVGRVSPATVPVPLPAAVPVAPDILRSRNPWVLPMTGKWRFALTRGRTVAGGLFQPAVAGANGVSASSNEEKNPPENAFDGSEATRWCADGPTYPQFLQADLGKPRPIAGLALTWERANERYRCRVEGSADGKHWKTLSDASAEQGLGDGPVALAAATARYVRVTVLGTTGNGWASIRKCALSVDEGGKNVAWRPAPVKPLPTGAHDEFARLTFNDAAWDDLAVPSNWEMAGYSIPTYNSVDTTVGQYRRWVTVPAAWAGRHIVYHFDGALDGAEVYVNGVRAGYHESGYTAWDIDLTGLVTPGRKNLFAIRVSKSTPSSDCETGDFQAMGGIYRDNFLIAIPPTHVHDITVRTPLAANYRDATLVANLAVHGAPGETVTVSGKLYGSDGRPAAVTLSGQGRVGADGTASLALSAPVTGPRLWSAEKPNLYYVVFDLMRAGKPVERVEQRFGFRQVEVKNNVVLWNGKPIKCTGVCRHDFWADKGFALTDTEWRRDLALMKAANVNAIRTSHYNHAARFLELCEEKGIYILDEVPFCWVGDQVKDPKFAPFLLQRAAETVARDKNRPCVLAWSIGNENPYGIDEQMVFDQIKRTDPTRPAFVSQMNPKDIKGQEWEDGHYPGPDRVDRDVVAGPTTWPFSYSEHPHIFYQKETQDYDPGASDLWSETLIKTWEKLWKSPSMLGSFIWEWQNQGIADKFPDKTRDFYYGKDRLRQENNKGIVDAYRHPKAEWWIVKMAYSPVVVGSRTVHPSGETCTVPLTNHYSFTNLNELACHWTALKGAAVLKSGVLKVACAPMQTVDAVFPAPAGTTGLRLDFIGADGGSVVAANLPADDTPLPAAPVAMTGGDPLMTTDTADALAVRNGVQEIVFDKQTGTIRSWTVRGRRLLAGGPVLNLGEAKDSGERGYYRAAKPPVIEGAQVASSAGAAGAQRVVVTGNVRSGTDNAPLGTLTCTYDIQPNAEVRVAWSLDWTAADTRLWEAGVKLATPVGLTRMTWQRDSYFADYPAGHMGEPAGACSAGSASFRASKRGLHWMTLTTPTGAGLALLPADLPLTARANTDLAGTTLFASREVAPPVDFSGRWASEHDIQARKGAPLTGAFTLRAIAP